LNEGDCIFMTRFECLIIERPIRNLHDIINHYILSIELIFTFLRK